MSRREETAAVIPCLNEARTIGSLVRQVRQLLPIVIVVDDGSTDSTRSEAERAGATVICHSSPHGKGASLRAGFEEAFSQGRQWALAMDGDGQHSPADIPRFLSAATNSSAAMFIGNRMETASAMPLLRRMVNRTMSRAISGFCGVEIPDSQCGFRMVNLHAWKRLPIVTQHFEIESEMIVRFLHAGYPINSVSVQTRYASENSKIRPFGDTVRWLRWWISVRNELAADSPGSGFKTTPQDATA
jgi:glycosyltransferase involved in cell wall biosynthesis